MVKPLPLERRYGYLTVGEQVGRTRRCVCDCGTVKFIRPPELFYGRSISCGCRYSETRFRKPDPDTSHPEYFVWVDIKRRCYDPTRPAYRYYGGRGITMSEEWRTSFRAFLRDMGSRPSPDSTVEREDNNGPYAAENCVWADRITQANNQRRIKKHSYRGHRATLAELCRAFGKRHKHVSQRLRLGWSIVDAMDRPLRWRGNCNQA